MRNIYISLIVFFVCNTQIFANTFFQKNRYQFKSMMFVQDITSENESEFQLETFKDKGSFKSPGKALLYSGVLPGMGQAYMGNWLRGLLFVGLDAAAIGIWYNNNNLAEDKKNEYKDYANEHWDFGRWVRDYYKWYEYKEGDNDWNEIREVFINYSDSTTGCAQDPSGGQCYTDIWDHSHKVEFTWDGVIVNSNSDLFMNTVFEEVCGNSPFVSPSCSNDSTALVDILSEHSVYVIKDHHFYEGIQKYDMFFAGWDDNDSIYVITNDDGSKTAMTPHILHYQGFYSNP